MITLERRFSFESEDHNMTTMRWNENCSVFGRWSFFSSAPLPPSPSHPASKNDTRCSQLIFVRLGEHSSLRPKEDSWKQQRAASLNLYFGRRFLFSCFILSLVLSPRFYYFFSIIKMCCLVSMDINSFVWSALSFFSKCWNVFFFFLRIFRSLAPSVCAWERVGKVSIDDPEICFFIPSTVCSRSDDRLPCGFEGWQGRQRASLWVDKYSKVPPERRRKVFERGSRRNRNVKLDRWSSHSLNSRWPFFLSLYDDEVAIRESFNFSRTHIIVLSLNQIIHIEVSLQF